MGIPALPFNLHILLGTFLMCRNYRTRKFFHDKSKILLLPSNVQKFLGGLDGKESTCDAGDLGLIPGSGKSFGEGNGNPLQYSCLENSMDRGAWQATVQNVAKNWTQQSD